MYAYRILQKLNGRAFPPPPPHTHTQSKISSCATHTWYNYHISVIYIVELNKKQRMKTQKKINKSQRNNNMHTTRSLIWLRNNHCMSVFPLISVHHTKSGGLVLKIPPPLKTMIGWFDDLQQKRLYRMRFLHHRELPMICWHSIGRSTREYPRVYPVETAPERARVDGGRTQTCLSGWCLRLWIWRWSFGSHWKSSFKT